MTFSDSDFMFDEPLPIACRRDRRALRYAVAAVIVMFAAACVAQIIHSA